jgi:hypothetical protein
MGLGELLTTEEKIASLEKIKKSLSLEIYRICFHVGIDPDTFDYTTYVCPDRNVINGYVEQKLKDLEKHSRNLTTVIVKLEALENA